MNCIKVVSTHPHPFSPLFLGGGGDVVKVECC